jgi:tRNA pseudouridine38-40 synthase
VTRFKLRIEYDGGGFVGWQRQDNGPSIQAALEAAVEGFCGEAVTVIGAGRTDAGVHALGQVAHLDLARETRLDTLRDALNHHLKPAPIAVLMAEPVAEDFHARFSATARHYLYRIVNRRAPLALDRGRAWFVPVPLDAAAMQEAAQVLVGHHDFSSFRAAECQADSPVKTLDQLEVARDGDEVRIRRGQVGPGQARRGARGARPPGGRARRAGGGPLSHGGRLRVSSCLEVPLVT